MDFVPEISYAASYIAAAKVAGSSVENIKLKKVNNTRGHDNLSKLFSCVILLFTDFNSF